MQVRGRRRGGCSNGASLTGIWCNVPPSLSLTLPTAMQQQPRAVAKTCDVRTGLFSDAVLLVMQAGRTKAVPACAEPATA